jgi:hypothetical protein
MQNSTSVKPAGVCCQVSNQLVFVVNVKPAGVCGQVSNQLVFVVKYQTSFFIDGGNPKKPPTCCKSPTNFNT